VKKKIAILAGVAAVLGAAYLGARSWAQQTPPAPQAPAQIRTAFVNFRTILQNYQKAKFYDTEMVELLKEPRKQAEKLKAEIEKWQKDLQDPKSPANRDDASREQWQQGIVKNKRDFEDLQRRVGKMVAKREQDQFVQIYREIKEAIKGTAASRGFHVVIAYGEEPGPAMDLYNMSSKIKTMQTGGSVPIYFDPGLDISQPVVDNLNRQYSSGGAGVSSTPPSTPPRN
jgi:Skp family chaperone for outer membrane proteins